jgi:hypothetical protein
VKTCTKCGIEKDETEFNKSGRAKDGLNPRCRQCQSDYYYANRERHLASTTERHRRAAEENKMRYCAYLEEHECLDCGETNILVLEPDHVRGEKKCNVSELVLRAYAWTTIEAELAKCEIVCANCHRDREARRQENNYKIRYLLEKYLLVAA